MSTQPRPWEKEFDEKFVNHMIESSHFEDKWEDFKNRRDLPKEVKSFISSVEDAALAKVGEEGKGIIGLIIQCSEGFDTVGNKRIWRLDIDEFVKRLSYKPSLISDKQ